MQLLFFSSLSFFLGTICSRIRRREAVIFAEEDGRHWRGIFTSSSVFSRLSNPPPFKGNEFSNNNAEEIFPPLLIAKSTEAVLFVSLCLLVPRNRLRPLLRWPALDVAVVVSFQTPCYPCYKALGSLSLQGCCNGPSLSGGDSFLGRGNKFLVLRCLVFRGMLLEKNKFYLCLLWSDGTRNIRLKVLCPRNHLSVNVRKLPSQGVQKIKLGFKWNRSLFELSNKYSWKRRKQSQ